MSADFYQQSMVFSEYKVGQKFTTTGRTVTEADIISFAGLSGDFHQIHINEEYAKKTTFGRRVAHGLLGLSIVSGLAAQTGLMEHTVIAFREIKEWKFIKPVFIGDTLLAEMEVLETKEMPRIGGGAVEIKIEVVNQNDEVVMRGIWVVLVSNQRIG